MGRAPHDDPRGESRWPPTLALACSIVPPLFLTDRFTVIPPWVVPALLTALLVANLIADPGRVDRRSNGARGLSLALVAVLVVGSTVQAVALVIGIAKGTSQLDNPTVLMRTAGIVWVNTVVAFSFLYWQLDGGGPATRLRSPAHYPDFAFPQHLSPAIAPAGWRPVYFDHLYLSLTNALAFSPTDTMPLVHWAKLTMGVQEVGSLLIMGFVIARAVNIVT